MGTSQVIAFLAEAMYFATYFAFALVFLFFILKILLRNRVLVGMAWVFLVSLSSFNADSAFGLPFAMAVTLNVLIFLLLVRFGFLAMLIALFVDSWLGSMPATFHASAWYSGTGFAGVLVFVALAFYGFRTANGGRPILDSIGYEK